VQAFLDDMKTLRIQQPEKMPRATDHIEEMLSLIGQLKSKGMTYEVAGSTYYRISEFSGYGRLSGLDLSEVEQTGEAQEEDEYSKENPRDFALWKAVEPGEAGWDSPYGRGRPGWHVECSAMSMKYLGESFDIHCGGEDLVFPHHENEIAQSEGATGKPFVKYWVHAAHLIVEGEKMSKSAGNFFTLRDLIDKGYSPVAIRYLLSSVHYRKRLNFTFKGLDQALASVQRVDDFLQRLREVPDGADSKTEIGNRLQEADDAFEEALGNDLNSSAALAALFELIRDSNILLDEGKLGAEDRDRLFGFVNVVNQIFDVFQVDPPELDDQEILNLIEERVNARHQRDYGRADEIRIQLEEKGILLEDTKDGTRWKKVHQGT
jgi:cysteinyl-tRNA synthetase